jgi:hypothetical protein
MCDDHHVYVCVCWWQWGCMCHAIAVRVESMSEKLAVLANRAFRSEVGLGLVVAVHEPLCWGQPCLSQGTRLLHGPVLGCDMCSALDCLLVL